MNKVKIATGISIFLFFVTVTALLAAALIYNQQQKSQRNKTTSQRDFLTLQEVAKHSISTDCWIVIDNGVYDVSRFLINHPGGANTIIPYCGKDASTSYLTKDKQPGQKHTSVADKMLEEYFIGNIGQEIASGITPTPQLTPMPTKLPAPTKIPTGLTLNLAEISRHNNLADCWLLVNNRVYDVTRYIVQHPGGANMITRYCGSEATTAFNTKDSSPGSSHSQSAVNLLNSFLIGSSGQVIGIKPPVGLTPIPPTMRPTTAANPVSSLLNINTAEVSRHNNLADCWIIVSNNVYNVTSYIVQHPGGANAITNVCGKDGTTAFQTKGGKGSNHSGTAYGLLGSYVIGSLGSSVTVTSSSATTTTTGGGIGTGTCANLPVSICTLYPGATLIKGESEDNGGWEGKINTGSGCRQIKTNSSGAITTNEGC